jgi:hypothetical protein
MHITLSYIDVALKHLFSTSVPCCRCCLRVPRAMILQVTSACCATPAMSLPAGLRRLSIAHASKLTFGGAACLTRLTNLVNLEFEVCGDVVAPWDGLLPIHSCVELPAPRAHAQCLVSSDIVAMQASWCWQLLYVVMTALC